MTLEIGELTFLRQLAPRYAVPVPEFMEWPAERKAVQECLARWKSAVAKADILAGGRGKAGLMEKANSASQAIRALKRLSAAERNGRLARTSYLVQDIPAIHEVYTAFTYDSRFLSPAITLSLQGGMEIESVAESQKRTFPVDVYQTGSGTSSTSWPSSTITGPRNPSSSRRGCSGRSSSRGWPSCSSGSRNSRPESACSSIPAAVSGP